MKSPWHILVERLLGHARLEPPDAPGWPWSLHCPCPLGVIKPMQESEEVLKYPHKLKLGYLGGREKRTELSGTVRIEAISKAFEVLAWRDDGAIGWGGVSWKGIKIRERVCGEWCVCWEVTSSFLHTFNFCFIPFFSFLSNCC